MQRFFRGGQVDWQQLICCRTCCTTYVQYLLTGDWPQQITIPIAGRDLPTSAPSRHGPLRDYAHIVYNGRPIPSCIDITDPTRTGRRSTTHIGRSRRQVPLGYIEVNGRPCLELPAEYVAFIGQPGRLLWFPPHVRLQDGALAIRLPEWSRAPCGPFLTAEEVFELARRRGRIRSRRRYTVLLFGLPTLALICFAIFFFGWFRRR